MVPKYDIAYFAAPWNSPFSPNERKNIFNIILPMIIYIVFQPFNITRKTNITNMSLNIIFFHNSFLQMTGLD